MTTPYQMSVDVENLLITRTHVNTNSNGAQAPGTPGNSNTDNPNPILWDPASMASVAIAAPITAAYSSNCTVTLKIYGSDQSLVKTLTQTVGLGGLKTDPGPPPATSIVSTTVAFTWDGTMDGGSSSAQAVKGIYLYQFNIASLGGYDDYDQDKSPFLTISSPAPTSEFLSDDGGSAIHRVWYQMASLDQPDPGRSASEGQIQIYDQETNMTALLQLAGMGPDPAPLSPGPHVVQATFPSPMEPSHVHLLVCPKDADADHDKGHRNRWALQHNQHGGKGSTIAFSYAGSWNQMETAFNGDSGNWTSVMQALGYSHLGEDTWKAWFSNYSGLFSALFDPLPSALIPDLSYDWWYGNSQPNNLYGALTYVDPDTQANPLQVLLLIGHGDKDGGALCISGSYAYTGIPSPNTQTLVVASQAYLATHTQCMQQNYVCLDSLLQTQGPSPLSNLRLVVVAGCDMCNGPLAQELSALGAQCVVSAGQNAVDINAIAAFLSGTDSGGTKVDGFLDSLREGKTIAEALTAGLTPATTVSVANEEDQFKAIAYGNANAAL